MGFDAESWVFLFALRLRIEMAAEIPVCFYDVC